MEHIVEIDLDGQKITLETGKIAKQANGAVVVRSGDAVVLVSACANEEPKPNAAFFPLTVDYREYTYSAGKIPGGFIKREGRPSEKEILTSRLIDRPIRPLFPEGFMNESQVIAMVLSAVFLPMAFFGGSTGAIYRQFPSKGAFLLGLFEQYAAVACAGSGARQAAWFVPLTIQFAAQAMRDPLLRRRFAIVLAEAPEGRSVESDLLKALARVLGPPGSPADRSA